MTRENVSNEHYKPAIMKLEVFNLLPILKHENVVIEGFDPKFERLFNLNFASNLKIVVKESKKSEREIYCHKMILCARSAYFRTMYHVRDVDTCSCQLKVANHALFREASKIQTQQSSLWTIVAMMVSFSDLTWMPRIWA